MSLISSCAISLRSFCESWRALNWSVSSFCILVDAASVTVGVAAFASVTRAVAQLFSDDMNNPRFPNIWSLICPRRFFG